MQYYFHHVSCDLKNKVAASCCKKLYFLLQVRTFEHERGMWAGHVSIEVGEMCEEWAAMLTGDLQMCPTPLHISLSRPLHLRHHWIEPLLLELRERAAKIPPFHVIFSNLFFLRCSSFSEEKYY
jgi:Uncharacterised conserved protein